ncbi:MAG TPA: hypothetical protein VJ123_10815 [Anaerolineales bacterium]|nr:hypothetical protein [Anaerolineales bacterium]
MNSRQTRSICTFLLAAGLLLAACNLPAPEPSTDRAATNAAQTLAAAPTLPPTWTSPPTATLLPTNTPTIPPSPTPTLTSTPGASPTPSAAPLPTDDPRAGINLSSPDYRDAFDVAFTWFEYSDDTVANTLGQGRLQTVDKLADFFVTWSTNAVVAGNLYVEVTAEVGACSGKDSYGIAIRVDQVTFSNGYSLEFSCDGFFRMRKFISGQPPSLLLNWTQAAAIRPGPNASNRIGLLADGATLHAFANGEALPLHTEDFDYLEGIFALFADARETPGLTTTFDEFALWNLTP